MSETDDTDELILIPPDLFTAEPPLEDPFLSGPYFEVVDSLISQVTKLEDRIYSIETKSETSFPSASFDSHLMSGVRKHYSSDDINRVVRDGYIESTQSTPQKPQTRHRIYATSSCTDSFSPHKLSLRYSSSDHSKFYSNPGGNQIRGDKKKTVVLKDIDRYISNIESSINGSECEQINNECFTKNSLNLKDLDYILKKVEAHEKELSNFRADYQKIPDNKNNDIDNERPISGATCVEIEPITSITDISSPTVAYYNQSDSLTSSSDSTQVTALQNSRLAAGSDYIPDRQMGYISERQIPKYHIASSSGTTTLPHYTRSPQRKVWRNALETDMTTTSKGSESTTTTTTTTSNTADTRKLLSLAGMWRQGDHYKEEKMPCERGFFEKLEEERLKKQHCEHLIQELQAKTLELQERLAVAVRVDEAKDDAILRFHKAWEQVAIRLQALTKERNDLEEDIRQLHVRQQSDMTSATDKISQYETEAASTSVMLQITQEKNRELEKLIVDLTNEIKRLNSKIDELDKELKHEKEKCKRLNELAQQKEAQVKEVGSALKNTKLDVVSSKKAIESCQIDLNVMKEQCTKYEQMVKERDNLLETLEKQNQKLLTEIDSHKKVEKELQADLNKTKELSEKEKLDLKYFYQEQVENVVREKLADFQVQLQGARSELEDDLKKREVIVAKTAATHIQQIADKHALEVRLLEEKHSEEVRLYQVQLSQAQQLVDNLQQKLQHQQHKKHDMAKQLHKLMEAQWLEALKIINNGRSPTANRTEHDMTNQLNMLKSKSYSNVEEVLSMDSSDENQQNFLRNYAHASPIIPPLNLASTRPTSRMECRGIRMDHMETPLTSRPKREDIQKYIHMLLHKQPASPVGDAKPSNMSQIPQEIPTWQPPGQDDIRMKSKDRKFKPPWK